MSVRALPAPADDTSAHRRPAVTSRPALPAAAPPGPPGNHDYRTRTAAGYFGYFGAAAGRRSRGYSFDVGA
jgi:hypothetical protein